ncbi:hypothetical protein GCM10028805_08500 [Spirosoma harenae]
MNTFAKSTIALLGTALTMSLVSCNKDSMLDSVRPENGTTETRPDNTTPTIPTTTGGDVLSVFKKYTLKKHGDWQLSYDANGDITKLQSTAEPNYYWEYIRASNGSGMTIQLVNNFKIWRKTLVLFDAKGRAQKTFVNKYDNNGNNTSHQEYDYLYTATGQLKSINGTGNQIFTFSYDGSDNLKKIDISINGKKQVMTYQCLGATDKNRLNPSWLTMYDQIDPFLPIYGKFSSKLMTSFQLFDQATNTVLEDVKYNYVLNSDGMVTSKEEIRKTAGQTLTYIYPLTYDVSIFKP